MFGCLFIGEGEFNQRGFRPGFAENGDAGGQGIAPGEAHWNIDGRKAGGGREDLAVVSGGSV